MKSLYYLLFGCGLMLMSQTLTAFQWQNIYSYKWYQADQAFHAGQYSIAGSLYQLVDHPDAAYNQGNALAYLADYSSAIAAYDRALQKNPQNQDAVFNRQIIMDLLKSAPQPNNKKSPPPPVKPQDQQQKKKPEKNIENQQWLNLTPDPTGSFLKEKFLRDYLSRGKL